MKYLPLLLLLFFAHCRSGKDPVNPFNGRFSTTQNGITTSAELQADGNALTGKLLLGGSPGSVTGTIDGNDASGSLHDEETGNNYPFTASVQESGVRISIRFPQANNQEVEFTLQRQGAAPGSESPAEKSNESGSKSRDQRLVGTWRHSEVLSSNSGGSYMSMATDYFIQFQPDGTALSWMGSSAGMGGSGGGNEDNPDRGQWFTRDNRLVFTDPVTGEEAETNYSVSENGLLLSNGSDKKIYERIN